MRNKKTLPFFIFTEAIISIGCLILGNYLAALGWSMLMCSNIDTLITLKENKTNDKEED